MSIKMGQLNNYLKILIFLPLFSCKWGDKKINSMAVEPRYLTVRDNNIQRPLNIKKHAFLSLIVYGNDTTGFTWVEYNGIDEDGIIGFNFYNKSGQRTQENYYSSLPVNTKNIKVDSLYILDKSLSTTPILKLKNDTIPLLIMENHPKYFPNYNKCGDNKQNSRLVDSSFSTEEICVAIKRISKKEFEALYIDANSKEIIKKCVLIGDESSFKDKYLNQVRYYDSSKKIFYLYKRDYFLLEK
jgi:hypothetical protein